MSTQITRSVAPVHGAKSVDGTAVVLSVSVVPLRNGVVVKAASTNPGTVYVGGSTVTANTADATDGLPLAAGESVMVEVEKVSLLYAIGSAAGQKVFFIGT